MPDQIAEYDSHKLTTASAKAPGPKRALFAVIRLVAFAFPIVSAIVWAQLRILGTVVPTVDVGLLALWLEQQILRNPFVMVETATAMVVMYAVLSWGVVKKKWLKAKQTPKASALHGTAGWATRKEIAEMNILPPKAVNRWKNRNKRHEGVFIGSYVDPGGLFRKPKTLYLRHDGPEHILAFAPTRSGKGVGLVLPTLLTWPHSAIVHDPKGEGWALSSGFRHDVLNQNVYHFDPANPDTSKVAAFNPLAEIRIGTKWEVGDAQNLATILADPEGKGLPDHWAKTAMALLSGLILHCCYFARNEWGRPARFSDVVEFLSAPEEAKDENYGLPQKGMPPGAKGQQSAEGLEKRLMMMRDYHHLGHAPHELPAHEAQSMIEKEDRERASVASTATSYLTLYRDPAIADNTGRSDWTIADLMDGDRPATTYLVVRPSDAERLRPLMRLIMTQIVRKLTGNMEFRDGRSIPSYKHRLLLLLDEFTALKKLTVIEEALAYMAGYGLKAYLIVQDIQQLAAVYGQDGQVISNTHIKICFAPNKIETAEVISKMLGTRTVVHKSAKTGGGGKDGGGGDQWQETSRPLMTAEEAARLQGPEKDSSGDIKKPGALLVIIAGKRPIYGTQVLYYRDRRLDERSKMPAPNLQYGEVGDTQGYEAVERATMDQAPIEYTEDETVEALLLELISAPDMGVWPAPACSGGDDDVYSQESDGDFSDDVAKIIEQLEASIKESESQDVLVGCADYARAFSASLTGYATDRVTIIGASPELLPDSAVVATA